MDKTACTSTSEKYSKLVAKQRNDRLNATKIRQEKEETKGLVRKENAKIRAQLKKSALLNVEIVQTVKRKYTKGKASVDSEEPVVKRKRIAVRGIIHSKTKSVSIPAIKSISIPKKIKSASIPKKKKSAKKMCQKAIDEKRRKGNERVKKYRANLSDEAKESIRAHDRKYQKDRKDKRIDLPINEMPKRKQRETRKKWRKYSSSYRERQANIKSTLEFAMENTPNSSPASACSGNSNNLALLVTGRASSSRKLSGRKQVKIGRSKLARDIKQKDEQLKKLTTPTRALQETYSTMSQNQINTISCN